MKVKRSPAGNLLAIIQHEENSYFWKSDLTECPTYADEKLKLEVLLMVDWWNNYFHEDFEVWWNLLMRFHNKKKRDWYV